VSRRESARAATGEEPSAYWAPVRFKMARRMRAGARRRPILPTISAYIAVVLFKHHGFLGTTD